MAILPFSTCFSRFLRAGRFVLAPACCATGKTENPSAVGSISTSRFANALELSVDAAPSGGSGKFSAPVRPSVGIDQEMDTFILCVNLRCSFHHMGSRDFTFCGQILASH